MKSEAGAAAGTEAAAATGAARALTRGLGLMVLFDECIEARCGEMICEQPTMSRP